VQVLRRIVLPQALTRMLPPIASTLITLVKDSSLVSVISVSELMWAAQSLAAVSLRPVEVLTGTGLLYVALTYPLSLLAELTRRRFLAL
jgi:polar amino acid transport system permease protein